MKVSKFRSLNSILVIALIAGAALMGMAQSLNAQDAEAATEEAAVEEAAPKKTLIDQYKTGGWAMYPLTFFSIAGFGLIFYNSMAVRPGVILSPEATIEIDKAVEALDLAKAKQLCEETPSPATNIVSAGLNRVDINNYDPEPIKEAIEEASSEELAGPFVLINYLSVIGSLAPMVGLLGTVSGMVKAFNVIEAEGAGSAQALAGNISEALITTASGMIVGIPAMFFFFYFKNKYGKITSRVARVVGDIEFTLTTAVKNR
ncbi:MAG: MotA/TolQ/ExbB proton channel family protein [Coraliomargarita sp.]|nr:MotA/TolQ/ExbB proton channel family protein [Coraliomargarita sp.]